MYVHMSNGWQSCLRHEGWGVDASIYAHTFLHDPFFVVQLPDCCRWSECQLSYIGYTCWAQSESVSSKDTKTGFRAPWTTTKAGSAKCSCGIKCLGFHIESLPLCRLSVHSTKTFDAQLLPGLDHCVVPAGDVLEAVLGRSTGLLAHDFSSLVDHEIIACVSRGSFLLLALEDGDLGTLASSNFAHCLLLHDTSFHRRCFHRLHGLHGLHCGLHWESHAESSRLDDLRRSKLQAWAKGISQHILILKVSSVS